MQWGGWELGREAIAGFASAVKCAVVQILVLLASGGVENKRWHWVKLVQPAGSGCICLLSIFLKQKEV